MSYDRMRFYNAGRFHDNELPVWYKEACHLSEQERIDWHRAFERVLNCEYTLLTEEGQIRAGLEIRFWPSDQHGILVIIETPLAIVEQVVVVNPADWLPFLCTYLAPLMVSSTQCATLEVQNRIANVLTARARHGEGSHVDRETGLSQIDLDNDRDRRRVEQARAAMARANMGGAQ